MSIYSACNVQIKGKANKYRLYLQWCLFFTGCPFLVVTGLLTGISPSRLVSLSKSGLFSNSFVGLCNLREICVSNIHPFMQRSSYSFTLSISRIPQNQNSLRRPDRKSVGFENIPGHFRQHYCVGRVADM